MDLYEPYPWECPWCYDWTEYAYVAGSCVMCDDTRIRWRWLRRLVAGWRSWNLRRVWKMRRLRRWLVSRCPACHRLERVCGRKVGKHRRCIPF